MDSSDGYAHQPVVAMTALVMKGDRERCIAAGMDGYLSKPIRPQELDDMLDGYMRSSRNLAKTSGSGETKAEPGASVPSAVSAEELLERIDDDRLFLSELLEILRGDYKGQIAAIRQAIAMNDRASLQKVAHALKGALGNLAASVAAGIAGQLESIADSGNLELGGALVPQLEQEMNRVINELENLCLEAVR